MSAVQQGPSDVQRWWGQAFATRDLDAMMALFAADAIWVSNEGAVVRGLDAIRGVFAHFLALNGVYEAQAPEVYEAGDIALLRSSWTVEGTGPDGAPVSFAGRTADVLRRQPDGGWLYVIDSPFGGG